MPKIFKTLLQEKYLFHFFIVVNALPIFAFQFYPSMDAAAHLYNSNIIFHLLFDSNSIYHQYFELNTQIVPNWTGHFVLAVFNTFLPAYLAEKILLLAYAVFFPLAFRYMVRCFTNENLWLTYLIFPFLYHFMFSLGYYNFSLSLIFVFFLFGYIHKNYSSGFKGGFFLKTGLLFTLLALTHIFGFVLFLVAFGMYFFWSVIIQKINNLLNKKAFLQQLKNALLFLLALVPGIILIVWHLILFQSKSAPAKAANNINIIDYLPKIQPVISYNNSIESVATRAMFFIILLLVIFISYNRIRTNIRNHGRFSLVKCLQVHDFWIILSILMFFIMVFLPNFIGGAGNVTNRFGLAFFIFLIAWINAGKVRKWVSITFALLFFTFNLYLIRYYTIVISRLNSDAVAIYEISQKIENNRSVFTINLSDHWLKGHFSNYLACEKSVFVNDNYEAHVRYFPVRWKDGFDLGKLNIKNTGSIPYDYVFVFGPVQKQIPDKYLNILNEKYTTIEQKPNIRLFKINK